MVFESVGEVYYRYSAEEFIVAPSMEFEDEEPPATGKARSSASRSTSTTRRVS